MKVLMISPGFPAEMPLFTRGLAEVGATVYGIGDTPKGALADDVKPYLSAYKQVRDLWEEEAVVAEVQQWLASENIDRVECLWEPGMILAAKLREALGAPGLSVEDSIPFRDKESMKQVLDKFGLRTPRHGRASTEHEVRESAERIGYPLIIKPIAGAGSADTYPVHDDEDLEQALQLVRHVSEVSVEEFIEGEEYTYDTVCGGGERLFENVAWYRPKPLVSRLNAWVNPQAICLKDLDAPDIAVGVDLGRDVLKALNFNSGFSHMEWFRTPSGEAVFGEIGARAPGGRLVHTMNYTCDIDLFTGWAEAVCYERLSQDTSRKFNAAVIFKRARGQGTVQRIDGLETLMAKYGEHVANIDLVRVGEPARDWRKVIVGDGWIVCRHPNLDLTVEMANHFSADLAIVAG